MVVETMILSFLRKNLDVLLLGAFTFCCMVAFVVHEKGWLRKEVKAAESYSIEDAVKRLRTDRDATKASDVSPVSSVDEADSTDTSDRVVPPATENGVAALGPNSPLGGLQVFPPDNPWNQPVDKADVDPLSEVIIKAIGADKNLFPDFGAGTWNGAAIGIPYYVVDGKQKSVPISFTAYGDQSDPGPYPIPADAPVEGAPNTDGDRHVIIVDRDNHKLYELFRAFSIANGQMWRADSGAIFDLSSNAKRPEGWTSADAAGLPIFPGLARYEEAVELGEIKHALRFTVSKTRRAYVAPASHHASREENPLLPPMGMRVRLKADFDITEYPAEAQVILKCLKKYGMILADNGSDWYISGAPDPRWNDDALRTLRQVKGSDLEVIQMEGLVID
ncbi:MAG: hypothetical protein KDA66_13605 [Planctomycetaceae bacterium]|nr:hypothetical protein [Planctomycetaceae bacterium]